MRFQESLSISCAFTVRYWLNTKGFGNIANGGVADAVANIRKCNADTVVAPGRVLIRELDGQVNDHLSGSWPTCLPMFVIGGQNGDMVCRDKPVWDRE